MTSLAKDDRITLPVAPNQLVGRDRERAAITAMLADPHTRLVTLTGPGGVGKTHLALDLANAIAPRFADGVVFVDLTSISDAALALPTIAQALGLRESPGVALGDVVGGAVTGKDLLIVLDNLEHLMAAVPALGALVSGTERTTFLVTSRAPLRLRIEREVPIPPLPLPPAAGEPTAAALAANAAVALFVDRSQAVRPAFALTDANASVVAEICRRLDGLPLAIELAAAMTRVLSPVALLARLEHRLRLLTNGATDLPDRQRTLRNAIGWSHDLLSPDEQAVFRRLAAFAGGASLGALETVCGDQLADRATTPLDILSIVASLVTKSLLAPLEDAEWPGASDEPRYRMLATIQEYATDQLDANDEADAVRRRHLDWLVRFAEEAEPQLTGPDQARWLSRLDADLDNVRTALGWALDHAQDPGLRLASRLWRYWATRGLLTEGHGWLGRFLAAPATFDDGERARAFGGLGNLALDLGDYPAAFAAYQRALAVWERLGNTRGIADALNGQGLVEWYWGNYASARSRHEQSLALRRATGDRHGQGNSLSNLGNAIKDAGDPHAARAYHRQALAIRQELGNRAGAGYSYLNLGDVARRLGDAAEARAMFDACLVIMREVGDTLGVGYAHQGLGLAAMLAGDARQASLRFGEALGIRQALVDRRGVVESVEGIASVAASLGDAAVAATLFGAAQALREQIGAAMPEPDRLVYRPVIESIRRDLPRAAFDGAWVAGTRLTLPEAAALAAGAASKARDAAPEPAPERPAGVLSAREIEVLRLVAAGLTNAQVAEQLYLSRRTVDAHLRRIYDRLDLASRAEAIRYAIDRGLA